MLTNTLLVYLIAGALWAVLVISNIVFNSIGKGKSVQELKADAKGMGFWLLVAATVWSWVLYGI